MAKSKISASLLCGEENNISKKICVKSVCMSALLIAIGIGLFVAMRLLKCESNTAAFFALGCGAIIFVVWGCINLCCRTQKMCHNKSTLSGRVIYISSGAGQEAIRHIENQDWESLAKVISHHESNIKIDLVVSADKQFARCQVLTYIPYQFEPLSDVIILTPEGAEALLKLAK